MTFASRVLHASVLRYIVCAGVACANTAFAQLPSASCDMGEQTALTVKLADDMRPVGDAVINGTPVAVMLSTGAEESAVLNKKTLDRLGIKVNSSTGTMFPEDERNQTGALIVRDIAYARLADFSFGSAKKKNAMYPVEDFMDDTFGMRIGAGALLQTDLEIALDAGYIKAFKPKDCFREHLAYWDAQAVVVPALGDPWKRDPRVVFRVDIGGKTVHALLSTATPHSYLPKATAEWLGLTSASPGATRQDPLPDHKPDQAVWKVPVPSMSIGPLEVKNLDVRLMDLPHSGAILVLGADFLSRHRVYIAMSKMQIYFTPITTPRVLKRGAVQVIPGTAD